MNLVMGIDLGGGGIRCLLLDADTRAWRVSRRSWQLPATAGTGGTGFDLDLEDVWRQLGEASREVLAAFGARSRDVRGVSVSALRFGMVIVDASGAAPFAVPNRDARAALEAFQLAADDGDAMLRDTGLWPLPIHASARLVWLAANRPEVLDRGGSLLSLCDWVNFRLCGARATDRSQAGCTGLFDLAARDWSWKRIERMGLPAEMFPTVREPGDVLGELGASAAENLGLAAGTPVVQGGADTPCALLGLGSIDPGQAAVVAGTTAPVEMVLDQPVIDREGRLRSGHHVTPHRWVLESNAGAMGETLSWFSRLLFPQANEPELRLLAEADAAPLGAAGMLSTLGADVANDRSLGVPVGQLSLSHLAGFSGAEARRCLARAVVEGYACALRANLEQLRATSALPAPVLDLSGGLSRSDVFAQILADVVGAEVRVAEVPDVSALGVALCAGVGSGVWPDFAAAAEAAVRHRAVFQPDAGRGEASARLYADWAELREASGEAHRATAAALATPWVLEASAATSAPQGPRHRPCALVTAAFDEASLARLRGFADVEYASFRDSMQILTGSRLVAALQGVDVAVTEMDVIDVAALKQLPDLRVVAACRGDAVNIDVDACTAFGIPVLFAPGRNADAVADLAVGFMINLARRLPAASTFLADPEVTAGDLGKMGQAFRRFQGNELWRKVVGLVGLGAVGRAVALRLSGFGVRLLVADPYVRAEQAAMAGCEKVDLDTLLRESDFVSLHAAVTDETRGLLGRTQLGQMKPGAFLVNTARAALVDEDALIDALESGHLAGAALDTFAVEPPGFDHPLVRHASVMATPHVGGNTGEVASHQGAIIVDALDALCRGERPRCVLNPGTLDDFVWDGPQRVPDDAELDRLSQKRGPALTDIHRDANPAAPEEDLSSEGAPSAMVDRMRRILETFVEGMAGDPAVREASADLEVALYFVVSDLGLDCHLRFDHGEVGGGLGAPDQGSVVQLRMRAHTLDGMFTGSLNAMEAAMQGEIAFTGDAAKAMAIQDLQTHLERFYKQARSTVGDPGDLASLARSQGGAGGARPMQAGDVREDLVAITRELYDARVITATGGNVSVRLPDAKDQIWITPSQLFKGDLSPEVLVRIDLDGQSLDPESRSPSSEWSMHTAIFKQKPEARAVIHAHAPHATTLANTGLAFLPISTEAAFFGDIPRVPFIMPGTGELAKAVSDAMKEGWAVLMVNHGLVVCGRSLRRAADMVEIIERSAELILGCHAVGKEPPVLPDDVIETLRAVGDLIA